MIHKCLCMFLKLIVVVQLQLSGEIKSLKSKVSGQSHRPVLYHEVNYNELSSNTAEDTGEKVGLAYELETLVVRLQKALNGACLSGLHAERKLP